MSNMDMDKDTIEECEFCQNNYCYLTPWIKCESCIYTGRVQCDNCKTLCSLCNKLIHKCCVIDCAKCNIKICESCSSNSYTVFNDVFFICKNCKK
jgi:hypothetical protein